MTTQQIILFATLGAIVIMSLITFVTFIKDKKRAVGGRDRIKEKTLLALAACFGSVGALLGRIVARHKTEKIYFGIVIWFSLILHALLVVYLGYLAFLI